MGLFDFMNTGDPEKDSMIREGLLQFGLGLMSSRGRTLPAIGQSGIRSMSAMNEYQNNLMKQKYIKAQIGDMAAQEALRKEQAAKLKNVQDLLSNVLGPGAPSQYGIGGGGMSLDGVKEPMTPKPAGLAGASPEDIARLKANGVDISNIWETAQFGKGTPAGQYLKKPGQGLTYLPEPGKPSIDRQGNVFLPQGTAEATGALAGATTGAQEAAKAPYQLVPFIDPSGATRQRPLSDILGEMKPKGTDYSLPSGGGILPADNGTALRIREQELAKTTNPADRAALQREIDRLKSNPMYDVRMPGGPVAQAASPGIKTGFSPEEQATAAASKEYQTVRAKQTATDVGTIHERGLAAPSKISTLQYIGSLYKDFEGGTLSDFAKKVASTANSLGVQIDPKLGNKEAAAAISNKLAIELRNTGAGSGMPGSLSDSDREFLRSMTPQLGQTAAGRKQIIDAHVALAQRDQEISQFARNYENKYGKVDNGFFTQLAEWSKANPLFK